MILRPTPSIHRHIHSHQLHFARHITPSRKQQERTTSHYIWRTRGDGKVRDSHAANDGKIFSWDNPPETGHPGEDFGCRCIAEPYVAEVNEYAEQSIISSLAENSISWTHPQFGFHFYRGKGRTVTLSEIGHLTGVINYYFYHIVRNGQNSYDRVNSQILKHAINNPIGSLTYPFFGSYGFDEYSQFIGGAKVEGQFSGISRRDGARIIVEGTINYKFSDTFTDPFSERENNPAIGTSDPTAVDQETLFETDYGGTYFNIEGTWRTRFFGVISTGL